MTGMQLGQGTVFAVSMLIAFLAGVVYAYICHQARKHGILPSDPRESVPFTVIGVCLTLAIAGVSIGWENAAKATAVFVGIGIPQYIEGQIARMTARKQALREELHDAAKEVA